ncbi:Dos2-interacting transcription regulator of RNA-Pol-II-domain-containing protein [Zychaea mexicana]|uniref:Dos2-interacting transcription regulator of RNA-Pol-II-domain-containing protein n=1 Tax=Zychaea mexicana TaxID=64656 RepID=UPI0022FE140C|nr:Dos2-interacting transcription regulator of RNA-Pol-II-domain-containing protein [Zychaea mexicana]KAI9492597.1 Dos2-interacting transcription regulator of RNA-Pol-II-domain-containing protein [Zychaea mexicana]
METRGLIQQWLISSQTEVKPSLLAQILLDITRDPSSILTVTDILSTQQGNDPRKCVDLLAQVTLHSRSTIIDAAVDGLLNFACQRLDQQHPIIVARCLDMIKCLMESSNISGASAMMTCESMISNLPNHKMHQDARYKTLMIIDKLLQNHVEDLRQGHFDFVSGFIALIDGEKDPRNLLICFELVRDVIAKFDISSHIEDLFDFVFCYFPITFKPPPNDPYQITTEDLKQSLRQCLASTPYFANFATPLLIDKLLTSTGSAKRDTMETIGLCAPAYGAHALLPHAQSIFDILAKEVYNAGSVTMETTALETIHNVVATLASGICVADIRVPVEKAIWSLLDPCVTQLQHPESKNAKSAGYILRAAASAADPACACVVHTIVPMLTGLIHTDDSPIRRKAIVDIFIEILKGNNSLYGSLDEITNKSTRMDDDDSLSPLATYKQEILTAFMSALSSEDEHLRLSGIKGIRLMVVIRRFLLPDEFEHVIQHLIRIFIAYIEDQTSRAALATLVIICKVDPTSIEHHVLPVLLDRLSDGGDMIADDFSYALEALDALSFQPQIARATVPSLMDKLGVYLSRKDGSEFHFAHSLTRSILTAIRSTSKNPQMIELAQRLVFPQFLLQSIKAALGSSDAWRLDKELINLWALTLAIIQRNSSARYQQTVIVDAFNVFVYGDLSTVPIQTDKCQPLLLIPATTSNADISVLFPAIAGNCKEEVEAPVPSCPELIGNLGLSVTKQEFLFSQKLAIARIVGSIANKCKNAKMPDSIKALVTNHLIPTINNTTTSSASEPARRASVFLLSWLAKALLIKGHKLGFELLDSLLQQLQSPDDLGAEAAESFIVILHDDDLVLTKAAFAKISILYKQRVFYHCISALIKGAESSSEVIRINHLVAFSHIINNIPTQIITNEIQKLVPAIIASLTAVTHPHPLLSLIRVIETIAPDSIAAKVLSQDLIEGLVEALVNLTTQSRCYRMDIRMAALRCLRLFAIQQQCRNELRFLAPVIVKHLAAALDDKKRQVRKEAVSCREKWFNLMELPRV